MLLSETPLNLCPSITVLKSSDVFNWDNVNVSLTGAVPYDSELTHGGGNDLWMSMTVSPLEMTIVGGHHDLQLKLLPNQICIHSPHTVLTTIRKNQSNLLHVFLKRALLSEVLGELFDHNADDIEIISKFAIDDPAMIGLLRMMQNALFEPAEHSHLKMEYLSRALAADVFTRHLSTSRPESPVLLHRGLSMQQIRRVTDYIHAHLATDITSNDLADVAGTGRTSFIQCFKTSFKETPHQHIIQTRIRQARTMLSKSNRPLVEIALLCGFSDQAHFSRCFRKLTGVTPSAYRRSN